MKARKKSPVLTPEALSNDVCYSQCYRDKDNNNLPIIARVRELFLSGGKYTANEINSLVGFNDARKVISTLRSEGFNIQDYRLPNQRKVYFLKSDNIQFKINFTRSK